MQGVAKKCYMAFLWIKAIKHEYLFTDKKDSLKPSCKSLISRILLIKLITSSLDLNF